MSLGDSIPGSIATSTSSDSTDSRIELDDIRESDLPTLAEQHRELFEKTVRARMGDAYVRAWFRFFMRTPDAIARVARSDGEPAAWIVGAPVDPDMKPFRTLWPHAVGALLARPWLLVDADAVRALLRQLPGQPMRAATPAVPTVEIRILAVRKPWRQSGLAWRLADDFVGRAFRASSSYQRIVATSENAAVLKMLEAIGWRRRDFGPGDYQYELDRKPKRELPRETLRAKRGRPEHEAS